MKKKTEKSLLTISSKIFVLSNYNYSNINNYFLIYIFLIFCILISKFMQELKGYFIANKRRKSKEEALMRLSK